MAVIFGKRPVDWLRLPETERYVEALCRKNEVRKSHFVKTAKGGNTRKQGTWLHSKLAVRFAQWLDVDFAIWCDEQIETMLTGGKTWQEQRSDCSTGFRVMCAVVKERWEAEGRQVKPYHFMNEARLINQAVTGKWAALDRDGLDLSVLAGITALEVQNCVLIAMGKPQKERKKILQHMVRQQYKTLQAEVQP